jgi:Transposase
LLQKRLVEIGCDEVFGGGAEKASRILAIEVNESQLYRCCQNVAEAIADDIVVEPSKTLAEIEQKADESVYAMVDGSMMFMDEGWKEVKLGRVFKATQVVDCEELKWEMGASNYVAKRGEYQLFTAQFEKLLPPDSLCQKIFVTDGATWIQNWIKESYPGAVHILDFFHVCEKLGEVAPNKTWLDEQKAILRLSGGAALVKKSVELLVKDHVKDADKVLTYLENNQDRMGYASYREQGWMIGSGPIESAHRTVLQVRMKRSGQRWANHGCDNMIKLRLIMKNNQHEEVRKVLKTAA